MDRPMDPSVPPVPLFRRRLFRLLLALLLLFAAAATVFAEPLRWFDGPRPGARADEALRLLAAAGEDGLDPTDYGTAMLTAAFAAARRAVTADPARPAAARPAPDAAALARLDALLTAAMQRYLSDLHRGRIDPRRLHPGLQLPAPDGFDAARALDRALAEGRLAALARAAAPSLPYYTVLRDVLARYRALEAHPAWKRPLPPLPRAGRNGAPRLDPGGEWAGAALLAERLAVLGDLTGPLPAAVALRYDAPLADAVRAFQRRHGLDADGVIGEATISRLEVTPAARSRQIALAMERLRWTPLRDAPRMILVNVPEFVLRGYEVDAGRIRVRTRMRVVVGRALDTRTPLIQADLRHVEFSPYWNVPSSIARGELLPALRRDPARFARDGYEFVGGGVVDQTPTAANLDAVAAGRARIRQRPGPRNALGDIKFAFPNRDSIYLHHTPATQLFARTRRDFSHGCIRVEDPVALARFVFDGMPEWNEARIVEAMAAGVSRTVPLVAPIPVLISYGTTIVDGATVSFLDDLYGHDRALDAALRAGRRPPAADG